MTGIIDRLRTMQGMGDIQLKALMDGVGPQAADEIERLQSVIAGLRADFETAHARMMTSAAAEREACAQVCDEYAANSSNPMNFSENCAAAIRARGEK